VARAAPSRIQRDVEQQLVLDRNHDGHQGTLLARMAAVLGAQKALAAREQGAGSELQRATVGELDVARPKW
jgi:hypothetical protein